MNDHHFLEIAIQKSEESVRQGGFPAGAVIVIDDKIIAEGLSTGNILNDPTSHGEIAAIRDACRRLHTSDLSKATLYTSMQPCLMCLGACAWCGLHRVVYACSKNSVSPEYYAGNYRPEAINSELAHPLELIQLSNLEDAALSVIRHWEKLQS